MLLSTSADFTETISEVLRRHRYVSGASKKWWLERWPQPALKRSLAE
jgi:hypothetical protein